MASKKDMRRADLVIPYVDPPAEKKEGGDMATTLSSTMPMAAMFTRNKMIAWASVVFSLQTWLAETPEQKKTASTPAYFAVLMSGMSLVTTYLPMFLPPPPIKGGTGTEAPAAAPPS